MVKTIAESLNEMKKDAGISNRKLAELSGVPEGTVNKILSGNTTNPSIDTVEAMIRAMGRSMDELFGEPETPEIIQAATIDHYSMLIDSYKDQVTHYRDQVEQMRKNREKICDSYEQELEKLRDTHKAQLRNHRIGHWLLLATVIILVLAICYLCVGISNDSLEMAQYAITE